MTLSEKLKSMFVDDNKSKSMMQQECSYNPDYEFSNMKFNQQTRKYEVVGRIKAIIDTGYAKELDAIGVTYKVVDNYGGEAMGSDYWTVWEFSDGYDVCRFKFDGYYQSYNGADFQGVDEVRPVTKTITVWE